MRTRNPTATLDAMTTVESRLVAPYFLPPHLHLLTIATMSISTIASLGMAIGAPLLYADQAYSIYRKQDARGFSHDVCAVLLIANITRCFFWLGERFEFALLLQSLLMIAAQLGLLNLCIRFRPVGRWSKSISSDGARVVFNADGDEEGDRAGGSANAREPERDLMRLNVGSEQHGEEEEEGYADKQPLLVTLGAMFRGNNSNSSYGQVSSTDPHSSVLPQPSTTPATNTASTSKFRSVLSHLNPANGRPLNLWQWSDYNSYLIFLSLFILLLSLLYLPFSSSSTFISLLGYLALGLESTLPIPQLISNYRRKSLAGFRASVLVGWLGGDSFKLLYFVFKGSPAQFTSCAIFQLSIDLAILAQSRLYKEKTEREEEEMRKNAEAKQARRANGRAGSGEGDIEGDITDELPPRTTTSSSGKKQNKGKGRGKNNSPTAREDDGLLQDPHHVISIEADENDDEGDISNSRRK